MKTLSILLISSLLLCCPSQAGEPEGPPIGPLGAPLKEPFPEPVIESAGPTGTVAVMDVNQVFQGYMRFGLKMSALKAEIELASAELTTEIEKLQKRSKMMEDLGHDTEGLSARQAQIASEAAQLKARRDVLKQNFTERESAVYFDTYQELARTTEVYTQANDIGLVLRVSGDVVDQRDPTAVLQHINRAVVWYDESIDITADVTDALNEAAADLPPVREPQSVESTERAGLRRLPPAGRTAQSQFRLASLTLDPPSVDHATAVFDVNLAFEGNTRFTEAMAVLKLDLKLADSETRELLDAVKKREEQQQELTPASDAYLSMRSEIAEEKARIQARVNTLKQKFAVRESELYADSYQQMQDVIGQYAVPRGITLVLRVRTVSPDQHKPAEVLQFINKAAVWFSKSTDITSEIIAAWNKPAS